MNESGCPSAYRTSAKKRYPQTGKYKQKVNNNTVN